MSSAPTTHPKPARLGDTLEEQRLRMRMVRLERVIAALEERAQAAPTGAPLPLRHALRDFRADLERVRARQRALAADGGRTRGRRPAVT